MRWQYCNQNPQFNLNFGYGPAKEIQRYLLIIDNLANYVKQNCVNPAKQYSKDPASLWILSKRENLKIKVTDYLDCLEYHRAIEEIKNFLLTDLSKIYVQFIRDGLEDRKVQKVLYDSYFDGITLLAPFLPFFTEKLNLEVYKNESIHLQPWPRPDNKLINPKLESAMNLSRDLMQGILAARDKEKINVRWPLKKATVYVHKDHKEIIDKIKPFVDSLILKQTNIKEIEFFPTDKTLDEELQGIVFQYGHIALDLTTNKELEEEGFARELMRRVQALRKEAGLKKESKVDIFINIEVKLEKWKKQIQERCGAKNLKFESPANCKFNSRGEIKEKIFEIGFN